MNLSINRPSDSTVVGAFPECAGLPESVMSNVAVDDQSAYEMDEGPLPAADIDALRKFAAPSLPAGRVVIRRSLF